MKKNILLFCLALPILLMTACAKQTVDLNTEFTLDFNETVDVEVEGEKWKIKFIELVEESRCPPDVTCIWEGQVAVKIQINATTEAEVGQHTTIPAMYPFKNHVIHLLEVNYDKKENFGKEQYCSIRLRVE